MSNTVEFTSYEIADLCQDIEGVWRANIIVYGESIPVTRQSGSWKWDDGRREVLFRYAADLQERVRALEAHARKVADVFEKAIAANV